MKFEKEFEPAPDDDFRIKNVRKIASWLDREIRANKVSGYKGYRILSDKHVIEFSIASMNGPQDDDHVYFDPCVMAVHIENNVWITQDEGNDVIFISLILQHVIGATYLKRLDGYRQLG